MLNGSVRKRELTIVAVVTLLGGLLLIPAATWRRQTGMRAVCLKNQRQIILGIKQYERDYDERFPLAKTWSESLMPYTKNWPAKTGLNTIYNCPACPDGWGYAMNSYLSGLPEFRIKQVQIVPVIYDSTLTVPNARDTGKSWPQPGRHRLGNNVVFADAHIEWLTERPLFESFAPDPKVRVPKPKVIRKRG